jgi:putative Mn2+ efflux pump MntP
MKADGFTLSLDSVVELNYVQIGIQAVRLGEIPFSSAVAGEAILESAQTFMEQHDSWVSGIMLTSQ